MYAYWVLRASVLAVALAAPPSDTLLALKTALQTELTSLAEAHPSFALQLGWTSKDGSFGLSAGSHQDGSIVAPTTPTDRFLFGSGTKPVTAVAVLRLLDAGKISLEDSVAKHVDGLLASNGTSIVGLFGAEAANVTLAQLLRMQTGFPDFDIPSLDQEILKGHEDWPPCAIIRAAAGPLHFTPGSHTEYSSTNFVLAGLVLLAHSPEAQGDWRKLDIFQLVFPDDLAEKYRNVKFINDEVLFTAGLTVPGVSRMIAGKDTAIWAQRGGILGWTCGNMAASAQDVSAFLHDLLVAGRLLKPATVAWMQEFRVLDFGWGKGGIKYGAGLMVEQSTYAHVTFPPVFTQWGAYIGHGGDTYGFLSEQGIVYGLGNASFSVISNQDYDYSFAGQTMACRTIVTAAKVLEGKDLVLACGS